MGNGKVYYRGFYPDMSIIPGVKKITNPKTQLDMLQGNWVDGTIQNDKNHKWDIATTYEINKEQSKKIYNFIKDDDDKQYNLYGNNCTTWAVSALEKGEIKVPTKKVTWTISQSTKQNAKKGLTKYYSTEEAQKIIDTAVSKANGYSPADAAQDIKEYRKDSEYVINYKNKLTRYVKGVEQ